MAMNVEVPAMHPFDPLTSPEGRRYLQDAPAYEGATRKFQFPADVSFWDDLVEFVSTVPQKPPGFQVTPSHKQGESLRVNQQLFAGFVRGWVEQHPHVVTVTGPDGASTFHASKQFWNDTLAKLRKGTPLRNIPRRNLIAVQSSLNDGAPPVYTDVNDWNAAVRSWEIEQKLSPTDLAEARLQRRQHRSRHEQAELAHRERDRERERERERQRARPKSNKFRPPSVAESSVCASDIASHYGDRRIKPTAVVDGSRASFSCRHQPAGLPAGVPPPPVPTDNPGFWRYGVLHYHVHQ
eukprot:TRINITY_DN19043_c0_g1_i1.p1 TRINITY_DN19043_c0_g1~~TRINITY_DN19043_c0_g1_i1.p1  ORF type:complete len:318 (+),score=38.29 TRINITY_DN19043_c0_g1_i1:70-954(+)